MYSDNIKAEFIVLRSQGWSISRIANHLDVSRPTLIKWNEQYHFPIHSLRAVEIEALHHSILEKHKEELAHLAKQQKAIAQELSKRKLDDVPTEKLFRIDSLLREEMQKTRAAALLIQERSIYIPEPGHPAKRFLAKTNGGPASLPAQDRTANENNPNEANNLPDTNSTVPPTFSSAHVNKEPDLPNCNADIPVGDFSQTENPPSQPANTEPSPSDL